MKQILTTQSKLEKTVSDSQPLFPKNTWNQQILKAIKIANKIGFDVKLTKKVTHNHVVFVSKTIYIKTTHKKEIQFYALLHEIGHAFLTLKKNYNELYCKYVKNYNTYLNRIEVLLEEIAAWEKATSLIKKYKLKINLENFDKYKSQCLASYARWISRRDTNKQLKQIKKISSEIAVVNLIQ